MAKSTRDENRDQHTKKFVLYQRVFYGNKPRLRRMSGDLVMPKGVKEVKMFFQTPSLYGVSVLEASTYIQNDSGIFEPEREPASQFSDFTKYNLDSVVLAHSFKVEDTRSPDVRAHSAHVAIRTRFVDGVVTGDISYVPTFKNLTYGEGELPVLERHLQKHRFIALYDFQNDAIGTLFRMEKSDSAEKYRKPHCIIINTGTIIEYGFQKKS